MIVGSVAMVASLFCCGCLIKKCIGKARRKGGSGVEEGSGHDEESAEDSNKKEYVPDRGTAKVPGAEYSYSAKPKPAKTTASDGPRVDQAFRGASAQETKHLLTPDEDDKTAGDSALRAEAMREVERIMAAPDKLAVLGGGAKKERTARFRKLARMLHPDKGLVEGDRASLALRRAVEAHKALASEP